MSNCETDDRPRVALVSTHGYVAARPPLGAQDTGGQVVYVLETARKMAQMGYAVDVWTRQFEDQPESEALCPHARILRVPCGGDDFLPKEYLYRHLNEWAEGALRLVERQNLKYLFVNSHYWDGGLAGEKLAQGTAAPHLHTPHSLGLWKLKQMTQDYPDSDQQLEKQYNFGERIRCETEMYARAHKVLATTPVQTDLLRSGYGVDSSRLALVPPGYDDNRYFPVGEASRQAIRRRLGFSGRVVMAIGRLARNKGYDLLIEAFALVAERFPDARLRLAVGGENMNPGEATIMAELWEQVRQLGLQDRVKFTGFVEEEEMADHYRAADLFVLSSRYEPFGMTAIEAMACGTPTVVTTHGGLFRVLTYGRHALFADPFDREDLGITMAKVLRHNLLARRLSRMGAYRARSLFTWTGITQMLVRLVEQPQPSHLDLGDDWDEPWRDEG
ncbi:MAG: glycosyltransferase [Candidatus Eremiobacteraeota bacterium]|nr:glycosyltransferase [Candidatus Eremiobacteraeota bacterium]MCW5870575.1 glycosyltransferase [Candidatus Eremiobacteraeota bacterium]